MALRLTGAVCPGGSEDWLHLRADCHVDVVNCAVAALFCLVLATAAICCRRRNPRYKERNCPIESCVLLLAALVHGAELGEAALAYWVGGVRGLRAPRSTALVAVTAGALSLAGAGAAALSGPATSLPCASLLRSILWMTAATARGLRASHLALRPDPPLGVQHVRFACAVAAAALQLLLALLSLRRHVRGRSRRSDDTKDDTERFVYNHSAAGLASKATFFWLNPLLWTGFWRPLELEDLGQLPPEENIATCYERFQSIYEKEKVQAVRTGRHPSLWRCYFRYCWRLYALGGFFKFMGDFVGFVAPLGVSVIVEYVAVLQNETNHTLPSEVEPTEDMFYYPTWKEFILNGYIMGIVIFLSGIAQGTFSQSSTHLVNVEGIRLKGALQAFVYRKALSLSAWTITDQKDETSDEKSATHKNIILAQNYESSNKAASVTDSGVITNLMSEDAFNIMSCFWIGHYIWAIPLKISVLMYLLYLKLGDSAVIAAVLCIIIMTPLQFVIGKSMSTNSKACTKASDERLRKMNELLQGIRLIKLYGWEDIHRKRILDTRHQELQFLNKDSFYWAIMTFLTHASSILVTLVTFILYGVMEKSPLSAAKVFPGLALFNQLTVPLFIFPITVPVIINAMISTKRLEEYLKLPEICSDNDNLLSTHSSTTIKESPISSERTSTAGHSLNNSSNLGKSYKNYDNQQTDPHNDSMFGLQDIIEDEYEDPFNENEETHAYDNSLNLVTIDKGYFCWSNDQEMISLKVQNMTIPKGKLTLLVGRVGSGKTSLLAALLGEMYKKKGKVTWTSCDRDKTVAYVAQRPWLLNESVRENILFGQQFKPRRYKKVIAACALQPDLDILPAKDHTEIGEKGICLSGGQKQRIAIARALYSNAKIIFLDDPLSALDYQVGQQVFENGIRRMLLRQNRTVVLVTHSLQLLSYAHQIIAMENGRIRAYGKLSDIENKDQVLVEEWRENINHVEQRLSSITHTAKERWRLIKLVSRFGVHLKQKSSKNSIWNADESTQMGSSQFVPFRKRQNTFSGSRYLTHDLPLPLDECEEEFVGSSERRKYSLKHTHTCISPKKPSVPKRNLVRVSSLENGRNQEVPFPVLRQYSSPSIQQVQSFYEPIHILEEQPSLLHRIFSLRNKRSYSVAGTDISNNIKERRKLRRLSSLSNKSSEYEPDGLSIKRLLSTASTVSDETNDDDDSVEDMFYLREGKLAPEEEREYGKIQKSIYFTYWQSGGILIGIAYFIFTLSWQALRVYMDYWLSQWTASTSNPKLSAMGNEEINSYLILYIIFSIVTVFLSLSSNGIGQYSGAKARKTLHDTMLSNILHCPVKFFELTPIGRIINRFSTDMSAIDKKIATSIQRLIQFLLLCVSAIFVNAIVTRWFLVLAIPICGIYYIVQKFYRCSSRELQRIDSLTRSPIFSHFTETLCGLTTIRAFGHQERFTREIFYRMNIHTNAFLILNASNRWLGIALDYLGGVIVFVAIITSLIAAAMYPSNVTPSLVGLAINYTLLIPIYLNWVVKFLADMEMYMSAVERIEHFTNIRSEDYRRGGIQIEKNWPKNGDITFENVSLSHDINRDPVISKLNLHIPAGQKIGICGRTGSGKSSLVMSLFHMVDISEGTIYIDNIDINKIPLQTLRSRLSIIPQDVIMFSGTIRENLDPQRLHKDDELWRSLELAQLKDLVSKYPGQLDGEVRDGGENLSTGERQLFCLARAILHGAACLIMDEATSSIDLQTEKALLDAAASAFADRTVITIAHRLSTILNYDRILVLDKGHIVEDGNPNDLLKNPSGLFTSMLRAEKGSSRL